MKAREEDYLELARSLVSTQTARPVFPSRQGFERICVTQLIDGLDAPENAVFDSYIISPLTGKELAGLMRVLENKCEAECHRLIMQALPDKWPDENPMLVDFIHQYNIQAKNRKADTITKAATKTEKCEIWRAYCKFLKLLLKP